MNCSPRSLPVCLFAAGPEVHAQGFVVQVATGTPHELAERTRAWGYDGLEYMPDPLCVPDPEPLAAALAATGAVLPVLNTGRLVRAGLTLLAADDRVRGAAIRALEQIIDLAGALGALVGLGIARGPLPATADRTAAEREAETLFRTLAERAKLAGTVILLEQAETSVTDFIRTLDEVHAWVERVDHPGFASMLDTVQLGETEPDVGEALRRDGGAARHLHLFEADRSPPGCSGEGHDWGRLLAAVAASGYRGAASVALARHGAPEETAPRVARLIRAAWESACAIDPGGEGSERVP